MGIERLLLPAYSPNRTRIERFWQYAKRNAIYGTYHPSLADFRAAVQGVLDGVETRHADSLASLMALNFQEFEDVSLLVA